MLRQLQTLIMYLEASAHQCSKSANRGHIDVKTTIKPHYYTNAVFGISLVASISRDETQVA